jgi:O-antigen/teichoic acid export membrane protein
VSAIAEGASEQTAEAMAPQTATATVIGRSFSFRILAQLLSALINVVGMVALGNYLAADGYGQYAFYYALVPLIASLSDLGVGVIITREIARQPQFGARYLGDALLIKLVVGAAVAIAITASAPFAFDRSHALLVWLVTITALVDLSQDVGIWVFRAHDRQDFEALLLLVSQVAWLAGILVCAALHAPLAMAIASATVAFLLRSAISALLVRRMLYHPQYRPDWGRIRGLIREGLPFGLALFAVVLYGRAGVLLLKALARDADVAYFNIGYMLSQPLGFISSAFSVSAFPALSRGARLGGDGVRPVLRSAVKFQFLAALPISVGLFLLSRRVVPLLLHRGSFEKAGVALSVMSLGLTVIFLNLMSRYVLAAVDQQRAYLRAILVGLVVNAAVSALTIRTLGYIGACVGLLSGEVAVLLVCQHALAEFTPRAELAREGLKPLLAALAMGAVVYLLRSANLMLVMGAGALVYVVMTFVLGTFSRDELRVMRRVYASFRLPGSAWLTRADREAS